MQCIDFSNSRLVTRKTRSYGTWLRSARRTWSCHPSWQRQGCQLKKNNKKNGWGTGVIHFWHFLLLFSSFSFFKSIQDGSLFFLKCFIIPFLIVNPDQIVGILVCFFSYSCIGKYIHISDFLFYAIFLCFPLFLSRIKKSPGFICQLWC